MSEFGPTDKLAAAALILRRVNSRETVVDETRAVLGPVSIELVDDALVLDYDKPLCNAPFRALQLLACDCEPAKRPMVRLWDHAREWIWNALEPDAVLLLACDFIEAATGTSRNDWSHELADQDLAALDLTPALETAFRIEAMNTLRNRGVI